VAFSPDGKLLASGGDDATIRIWDVETGQLHQLLCEHTKSVRSVCFSSNGNIFASIWDVETGQLHQLLCEHTKSVRSVCFSPDGNTLASAGEDETIKLWNLKTGECQNTLRSPRLYEQTNISRE
jgi:uncharacterized protein with WD repeat